MILNIAIGLLISSSIGIFFSFLFILWSTKNLFQKSQYRFYKVDKIENGIVKNIYGMIGILVFIMIGFIGLVFAIIHLIQKYA